MLSVLLTAHNEGPEVRKTVRSVSRNTVGEIEIVVVDDGSTDGCCEGLDEFRAIVVRHRTRRGVAPSRLAAARRSRGDTLAFLDAHQRVSRGCLDACARAARDHPAIIWPDVRGLERQSGSLHGATFRMCRTRRFFTARWNVRKPANKLSAITSLRCPGYVMSRRVFQQVRWIDGMRNWGGSEAAVSLKAFFLNVPILHLCGPFARHMFKRRLQYDATWDDVWRNQALVARVCFDDRTWRRYWLPEVFALHLSPDTRRELDSEPVCRQHARFQRAKVRQDDDFWTALLRRPVPASVRRSRRRVAAKSR